MSGYGGGVARVVELVCYPVKGCAGISLPDAVLTPAGLRHDRGFMVVDERGVFRSQRRDPRLARIRPAIDADGALTLRADGVEPLRVEPGDAGPRRDVTMFGDPYRAIDQGPRAGEWLSEVLGARSGLVRVPPDHDRVVPGHTTGTSGFADSSAVHLVALESYRDLGARIAARGGAAVAMPRFRPNVVVEGWPAYAEDDLRRVEVGEALLGFSKPAIRCAVVLVDQATGAKVGPEPLRTLATYRRTGGGVSFGVKFSVLRPGKLGIGDELAVTAWA